jgi:hypothetical protein
MNKNNVLPICLTLCALTICGAMTVSAQDAGDCESQAAVINARSALLGKVKESGDSRYELVRKKWDNRIAYAGQWVKSDAVEARDDLYKYDELHRSLNEEIDRQVGIYSNISQSPLQCSDDNAKKQVAEKFKAATSDQKSLEKVKKDETKHANGDFKKSTSKMVKSLTKAKEKRPAAEGAKLEVKAY